MALLFCIDPHSLGGSVNKYSANETFKRAMLIKVYIGLADFWGFMHIRNLQRNRHVIDFETASAITTPSGT